MLLAIDIGNTTITFGLLQRTKVIRLWHLPTEDQRRIKAKLKPLLKKIQRVKKSPSHAVICSVVPKLNLTIATAIKQTFKIKPLIIGKNIKVPIKNLYARPAQVGQDRLIGAYAAKVLYGFPVIVIDFGTAITFDIVSKKGAYIGGIIVPGIRLSAESLFKKTALLPQIQITPPKSVIGKNTQGSILSGIFYGYGALCRGLIDLIVRQVKIKGKSKVVITGGYAPLMKRFIARDIRIVERDLVFKGMGLLVKN